MLNLLVNDPFTPMRLTAPSFKFIRGQPHLWWQFCFRQLLIQGSTRVHFFGKLTTPNRAQQSDITVSENCTTRREAPAHLFGYAQQLCSHLRYNEAVKIGERNM